MPKLLLVKDNEVNRERLSLRLQRRGYQIISAIRRCSKCVVIVFKSFDLRESQRYQQHLSSL